MDTFNQLIKLNKGIFITLAEIMVFAILISLILYHLVIYFGRKKFEEGRLYLHFSMFFSGLFMYLFFDTNIYGILFSQFLNIKKWSVLFTSISFLIILRSILSAYKIIFTIDPLSIKHLNRNIQFYMFLNIIWILPVFFPLEKYCTEFFLIFWFSLGISITHISYIYFKTLFKDYGSLESSLKIIVWGTLGYITYIWLYRLSVTVLTLPLHAFWITDNILKISMAYLLTYAIAQKFNKEFLDLKELKENLEKKVIESTHELRLAKDKIEKASEQKTNYFINLAHETKTPLTLINNYINRHIRLHGTTKELEIIKQNFEQLKNEMIRILDVGKFEKGMDNFDHKQITNISKIINRQIPLFMEQAVISNLEFTYQIEKDIGIKADPVSIEKIVQNLMDNAFKYTNGWGKINIELSKTGKEAVLLVSNTGDRIDKKRLKNIFSPFYQVSNPKSNKQGLGIGLYIVKKAVESFGGSIEFTNETETENVFKVIFPFIVDTPKQETFNNKLYMEEPDDSTRLLANFTHEKKNILVVEDHPEMLQYLSEELADLYNVFIAGNGTDALIELKKMPEIDVILSDIMMDNMDGFELYNNIITNDRFSDIPFLFITARSDQNEKIRMLQKGVSDFIFKPFSMDELKAKIQSVLHNASIQRKAGLKDAVDAIYGKMEASGEKTEKSTREQIILKYGLTSRQFEIIEQIHSGLEYKQIADKLHLSTKTVHRHVQNLFEKLNVHSKIELLNVIYDRKA